MRNGESLGRFVRAGGWAAALAAGAGFVAFAFAAPVPTTLNDFFGPGTQPNSIDDHPIVSVTQCATCHGNYDEDHEIYENWAATMMGQAARDPLFHACLAIANQDAAFSGDLCIRCHTPGGWLAGNSTPTDGSALAGVDMEGVSCNFCHRMVDPDYTPGSSPAVDAGILADLATAPGVVPANMIPPNAHSGHFVVDPEDRRRGPFDMGPTFPYHEWLESPFHQSSSMCATCHDVSNPVYSYNATDGSYDLNALDTAHPTHDKYDQFPVERTYSEWLMSDFATGPIEMGGRFGGNITAVSSCQDCHMPDVTAQGCRFTDERDDMPLHAFNGGNNWVLKAIRNLYPDDTITGLSEMSVNRSIERAEEMLRRASDMELTRDGSVINVRIINESGHKLPTGYPEGRRMWLNVQFFDSSDTLIAEHGAYDSASAVLTTSDTKVYEGKLGIDADASVATGLPVGESFHFVLNNDWVKDNRIPPRGFTNAGFTAVQAAPVGAVYADGQHWDDTEYVIPSGATRVEARLFYQTASKEYIEFLRDENTTNTAGDVLYAQWELLGKSPPAEMDFQELSLGGCSPADLAVPYGVLNFFDLGAFLTAFNAQDPVADLAAPFGVYNFFDLGQFLTVFNQGCP